MSYVSLYRRFRPGRFSEVKGQEHVVTALRNAVREDRIGHAYLLSGPRGTGKTTLARILAKALNCENVDDGEPCGTCGSCVAIDEGGSFDLLELDAASNNKVDEMRELIARAALGSPGRTKVYILDEVHMLSTGASNALLKTLEEPPDHVVFVLATTDPQKVLATIRSRTQHFELGLLPADELDDLVHSVVAEAGLDVDADGMAHALRAGGGSARDTLSALDQVVAAGGVPSHTSGVDQILAGLAARSVGETMVAVADAISSGREPRLIGEAVLAQLRDAFLSSVGADLAHLSESDRESAAGRGAAIGARSLTSAMTVLGEGLREMRQAADPRIPLEVALVRIAQPQSDAADHLTGPAAPAVTGESPDLAELEARVARLERKLARSSGQPQSSSIAPTRPGAGQDAPPGDEGRLDGAPQSPESIGDAGAAAASPPAADGSGAGNQDANRRERQGRRVGSEPAERPSGRTSMQDVRARLAERQARAGEVDRGSRGGVRGEPPAAGAAPAVTGADPGFRETGHVDEDGRLSDAGTAGSQSGAPGSEPPNVGSLDRIQSEPPAAAAGSAPSDGSPSTAPPGDAGSDLADAWPHVLEQLSPPTRARFALAEIVGSSEGRLVLALPNAAHRDQCERRLGDVVTAVADHVGTQVAVELVVAGAGQADAFPVERASGQTAPARPDVGRPGSDSIPLVDGAAETDPVQDLADEIAEIGDVTALEDAGDAVPSTGLDRIEAAFPGAEVVEGDDAVW